MKSDRFDLYIFGLWTLGLLLFWNSRLPSDYFTALLFSLSLLFLAQNKLLAYCLLFPIICLNRYETAWLLILFYAIYYRKNILHSEQYKHDLIIMFQIITWWTIAIALHFIFENNGGSNFWFMPVHNFQVFLAHPWHSLLHVTIAGVILYFVFRGWNSKPAFLRIAFCVFAPILLIAYFIFGQPYEVRVLWESFPVVATLIYPSLNDIMTMLRLHVRSYATM